MDKEGGGPKSRKFCGRHISIVPNQKTTSIPIAHRTAPRANPHRQADGREAAAASEVQRFNPNLKEINFWSRIHRDVVLRPHLI